MDDGGPNPLGHGDEGCLKSVGGAERRRGGHMPILAGHPERVEPEPSANARENNREHYEATRGSGRHSLHSVP